MPGFALFNSQHHFQVPLQTQPTLVGDEPGFVAELSIGKQSPTILQISWREDESDSVTLTNLGCNPIKLQSGSPGICCALERNATVDTMLPLRLKADEDQLEIFRDHQAGDSSLVELTSVFGSSDDNHKSPAPKTLAAWFESLSHLQRLVAGSQEFFQAAAAALVEPGGLDGAMVLLPVKQKWHIAASQIPNPEFGFAFNEHVVAKVAELGQSHFHSSNVVSEKGTSESHWCVACPVTDSENKVLAVLYGFRGHHQHNSRRGIRLLEAQYSQLVADSVGSAMLRMQGEAEAARRRVLLEQAFSPAVARELESNPDILKAQHREVTVLFADLRGFTSISEKIGAPQTYRLLTEMMDRFCEIIGRHDGVIIDFYGDGVSAFWNAPLEQPDHAILACQAAMEIADCMPELDKNWLGVIGHPLKVGIGVNTGMAQVGNSGSSSRLKYGPQGRTVNVASRLENATKRIGAPVLISGTTATQVKGKFNFRRICTTFLSGFHESTDVLQIARFQESLDSTWETYANALQEYETGNTTEAISLLMNLQIADVNDEVCEFLLAQALKKSQLGLDAPRTSSKSEIVAVTKQEGSCGRGTP